MQAGLLLQNIAGTQAFNDQGNVEFFPLGWSQLAPWLQAQNCDILSEKGGRNRRNIFNFLKVFKLTWVLKFIKKDNSFPLFTVFGLMELM